MVGGQSRPATHRRPDSPGAVTNGKHEKVLSWLHHLLRHRIDIGVFGRCAGPPKAPPAPQFFTLNLPAGVSLVSAPLNTGQDLAINEFQGLPAQSSLFYGWNPNGQKWVPGDQTPAGLGGGYWVYSQTPTTLVVQGQPYGGLVAVSKRVEPGWHLFGVPFQEGIAWKDFHFHISGNPVGIETAVALGWVDPDVITVQGSQVHHQTTGQPLQPGVAYWIRTLVPLQLRAERRAGTSSAVVSNSSVVFLNPDEARSTRSGPESKSLSAQATDSDGESTGAKVMGWLGAIAEFLAEVAKGALAVAEGNLPAAGFDWAGGTFSLIEYGLKSGTESTDTSQLDSMDGKLDNLVVSVDGISNQLTNLNNSVNGLTSYIQYQNDLGVNLMGNIQTWLNDYYLDQSQPGPQSRNWARWYLAGCTIVPDNPNLPPGCPQVDNPVTAASQANFNANYMQNPGKTSKNTDDFPLWWANSVIGNTVNGVSPYVIDGTKASDFEGQIYTALTTSPGSKANALYSYMQYVLSVSGCATDVTAAGCDLNTQVYQPVEAFFVKVIGYQTHLAGAVTEASTTIGAQSASHGSDGLSYIAGVDQRINEEVAVFLGVAEQIALLRAADDTMDWNNFGAADAGILLARADFLAMQLGRQKDPTNPATVNLTPPWPASGVVGRVFYVNGEPLISGPRSVSQAGASNVSLQLSEVAAKSQVAGIWPYLLWKSASGTATGTQNNLWTVQRLQARQFPHRLLLGIEQRPRAVRSQSGCRRL